MEKKNTTVSHKGSVAGVNFDLQSKTCKRRYHLHLLQIVVAVLSIAHEETGSPSGP